MRPLAFIAVAAGLLALSLTASSPARAQEGPSLAVDVLPSGNTATALGQVQRCAAAVTGDAFTVDIVVQDVTDLIAWELAFSYDPAVLEVVDRDVQQFQAAGPGSQVLDLSDKTPDQDGLFNIQGVDTADPLSPDSGSGVLVRLTMLALDSGSSSLALKPVDLNEDGTPDRGVLLRAADGQAIGDEDGDSLFDGTTTEAEIVVDSSCSGEDAGNTVEKVELPATPVPDPDDAGTAGDGGSDTGLIAAVIAGVLGALVIVGAGAFIFVRRRSAGP